MDLSVIITCYNREYFIAEAIESAIGELGAEVIVVDDGSTDGSWDVIQEFSPKVRCVRTPNRGPSAARNIGTSLATRRFIRFLDSDDRIPKGSSRHHVAIASDLPPQSIAVGDAITFGSHQACGTRYGYSGILSPGVIPRATLIRNIMSPVLPCFPAQALREFGGFDERFRIAEDH